MMTNLQEIYYFSNWMGNAPRFLMLSYMEKSLEMGKAIKDEKGISSAFNNLGKIHLEIGDNEKALHYFQSSLASNKKHKKQESLINSLINIGKIHLSMNNMESANNYCQEAPKNDFKAKNKVIYNVRYF